LSEVIVSKVSKEERLNLVSQNGNRRCRSDEITRQGNDVQCSGSCNSAVSHHQTIIWSVRLSHRRVMAQSRGTRLGFTDSLCFCTESDPWYSHM